MNSIPSYEITGQSVKPVSYKQNSNQGVLSNVVNYDKQTIVLFTLVSGSVFFSFYLLNEIKKLKEQVKDIKIPEEFSIKINENHDSIKVMENKIDHLIESLMLRDHKIQQFMENMGAKEMKNISPEQHLQLMKEHEEQQEKMIEKEITNNIKKDKDGIKFL